MEPVIRSARLAPSRTKLRSVGVIDAGAKGAGEPEVDPTRALRDDIERQLRREMAAQQQSHYEQEFERARREGLSAAIDQARSEAGAELQRVREQLKDQVLRTLDGLERAHMLAVARLDGSVGEIAFAALCKLIGRESASRSMLGEMVAQTCLQLRGDTAATLRVHPRDLGTLQHLLQGPLSLRTLQVELVADESLSLGGCVAEATSGTYDGGLETQLRRLHSVIGAPDASAEASA